MKQRIHIFHIQKGGFRFQTHKRRINNGRRHCTSASRDNEFFTSEHDPSSKITVNGCEQEAWVMMTVDATPPQN